MSSEFTSVRPAAVAGQFYPGRRESLRSNLEQCLRTSRAPGTGRLRAMIVPHAGYSYSGATAGEAYALLRWRDDITRVVVLAPSHQCYFSGISVGNYESFETPLGEIPVDVPACRELVSANELISARADAHQNEHALEVQLPFLQTVLPEFTLVPVVCGQLDASDIRSVARALAASLWRPDTLWVVSSDFTHYGANFGYQPFTKDLPKRIEELDKGAVGYIEDLDLDGFLGYVRRTGATICGATPIAVLLVAVAEAAPNSDCRLLAYTTSGKMTGDYGHTVSYASILVSDPPGAAEDAGAAKTGFELSDVDKETLLKLAREAISSRLEGRKMTEPVADSMPDNLRQDGAAFVTLHIRGNLRGCIGSLQASEALYEDVINNARNAAFGDPRFTPLSAAELEQVDLEISVLTPPCPIPDLDAFEIGRHGIILRKGHNRAVFLPQVAPEQGWDKETTLTHLAMKAGLGPDDWRRATEFSVFEAIVFGDRP